MKSSNCCGSYGNNFIGIHIQAKDVGICGKCGEHCCYIEEELSPYEEFQLSKYGNILPDNEGEFEAGTEEAQRSTEWAKMKEEQELLNYENHSYE